jgi:hypothetical protein
VADWRIDSCHSSPDVRLSTKRSSRQLEVMMKGILFKLTFCLFVKSLKDWDGAAQRRGSGYLFVV